MIEIITYHFSRNSVEKDSSSMYIFTDNTDRTSNPYAPKGTIDTNSWYYKKYKPTTSKPLSFGSLSNPTSAVIRGLDNTYPISTMKHYGINWLSIDYDLFVETINDEIEEIKNNLHRFEKVKFGNYRIGQGGRFARLPINLQNYLDEKLKEIGIDNTGKTPIIL